MTNGMYSASIACTRLAPAMLGPNAIANGTKNARLQAAATLPKWWCQKIGAISGINAIDSKMPAKGTPHSTDSVAPSRSAARAKPGSAASSPPKAHAREIFMILVSSFFEFMLAPGGAGSIEHSHRPACPADTRPPIQAVDGMSNTWRR